MLKLTGIVTIIGISSACSVAVKDVPAPAALKPAFTASGAVKQPNYWWQSFNDTDLNHLCEQALSNNFSLFAAYNRLEQAKAVAKKTGADLIPQVNASVTGSYVSRNLPAFKDFALGLASTYEIDLWGRIRSAINAAQLDAVAAEEDFYSAAVTLTAEITTVWYRLIEQRQQLALLDRQIEVNKNNVTLVTVRFKGAQASAADVFQQQQLLESVIGNRHTVISNIAVLENQLVILTGNAPGTIRLPKTAEFPHLPELPDTGLSIELMQRRPDIRKAYYTVQAADQRVASAIADRLPKFSLSANVEVSSPDFQSVLNNWLATVAGNLVLPIVDGKRRVSEVERTHAVAAEALNNYAAAMLNAVKEVENALVQERQQRLVVNNLERQLELAQEATNLIRLRYINGAMDFLRVLSAILSQQSLERSLLQNRQQLIEYRISLYRSLAGKFPVTLTPTPQSNNGTGCDTKIC